MEPKSPDVTGGVLSRLAFPVASLVQSYFVFSHLSAVNGSKRVSVEQVELNPGRDHSRRDDGEVRDSRTATDLIEGCFLARIIQHTCQIGRSFAAPMIRSQEVNVDVEKLPNFVAHYGKRSLPLTAAVLRVC